MPFLFPLIETGETNMFELLAVIAIAGLAYWWWTVHKSQVAKDVTDVTDVVANTVTNVANTINNEVK